MKDENSHSRSLSLSTMQAITFFGAADQLNAQHFPGHPLLQEKTFNFRVSLAFG